MEVILKQDVAGLGYKNDLVTVKNGYARNYLIPQGFAVLADDSRKKQLEETKRQQAYKEEKIKTEAETIAKALEDTELTIGVKASTTGKIFGSVNNIIIADALLSQKKIEIDRKKIEIKGDAIKEVGKYTATVKLHREISVDISLDVVAE